MSKEAAIAFEDAEMPYGTFTGAMVGEVGTEYLARLVEGDYYKSFNEKLAAYVASDRFKERQRNES